MFVPARRSRAASTIASEPSVAITEPSSARSREQHRGDPAAAAAGVEDDLVAAQAEPLDHAARPLHLRTGDAVVGGRVPFAAAAHRSGRQIAVVGAPERRVGGLVGVDRVAAVEGDRDLVVAAEQAVLDVLLDLEADHAALVVDRLVVEVDPATAGLGDPAAVLARRGRPPGTRSSSS